MGLWFNTSHVLALLYYNVPNLFLLQCRVLVQLRRGNVVDLTNNMAKNCEEVNQILEEVKQKNVFS